MKLGLKLPTSGPFATPKNIVRMAQAAELCGYDSVWVHDHLTRSPADAENHFVAGAWETWERPIVPSVFEAVSTLAWLAGQTSRVTLGTSVIVLPLRNPVWLAKYFATIDQFSAGRTILGVGVGGSAYARRGLEALGHPEWLGDRAARLEEAIQIIRGVWREPIFTHDGPLLQSAGAEIYPKPVQSSLPIWYGGRGPRVLSRVGRLCDGWLPMYLSPEEIAEGRKAIDEAAETASRDPGAIEIASEHWLSLHRDRELAFTRSERTRKGLVEYSKAQRDQGTHYAKFHHEDRSDTCNLIGDPELVKQRIENYREAGTDQIIVRVIGYSMDEMIESIEWFHQLAMV